MIYPVAPGEVVGDAPREANLFAVELIKSAKVQGLPFKEVLRRVRTSVAQATRDRQIVWESFAGACRVRHQFDAQSRFAPPIRWNKAFGTRSRAATARLTSRPISIPIPMDPLPLRHARNSSRSKPATSRRSPAPAATSRTAPAAPPSAAPQSAIRDCPQCPEIVLIQPGAFEMGSTEMFDFEAPVHQVSIRKAFYIGRREVTFEEWDACLAEGGCKQKPDDRGLGRSRRPVTDLDWDDAKSYLAWLSQKTGKTYRLPSESEWEYVARAGTTTTYPWGRTVEKDKANCLGCTSDPVKKAIDTGSFPPNAFGVYDMAGNAAEWVEDCWSDNYRGAPTDGSAWTKPQCRERVLRGGSFNNDPRYLRSAARFKYDQNVRFYTNGFRVVREN